MAIDLKDYVDVATRLVEFRDKHPDGSLQTEILAYPTSEYPFVVVRAAAYRSPDDARPGIGHAAESFPGRTPYTRDSELQNAETSAWGRAIVAALAADTKRGIASAQEVAARQDSEGTERTRTVETSAQPTPSDEAVAGEASGVQAPEVSPAAADDDFTFDSGKYAGQKCSVVARAAPTYLRSYFPSLTPEQRVIAETWLSFHKGAA